MHEKERYLYDSVLTQLTVSANDISRIKHILKNFEQNKNVKSRNTSYERAITGMQQFCHSATELGAAYRPRQTRLVNCF